MKTTKKLISLALAAMLLLGLAAPVMAYDFIEDGDFSIEIFDDDPDEYEGWLLGYHGPGGDVVIPDTVTSIDNRSFYERDSVTSVTIPSSVIGIGMQAFARCENLKSVTIPSSVTYIYEYAFAWCTSLTDIYFGGTQEQWAGFEKSNADMLLGPVFDEDTEAHVTVHYNSTGPAASTTPAAPETPTTPAASSFTDVAADSWYADAVKWAVEKNITTGTSATTFSPETTCTTAQILTFLWRACGSPKTDAANAFTDVATGDYYYDAALWASSKGMVSGTTLSPDTPCTRAATVMFIWQAMDKPTAGSAASFTDVSADADYAAAVAWAVEKGVTTGTSAATFSPDTTCTRGQIVTFLNRAFAN